MEIEVQAGDPSRGFPLGVADWWEAFYSSTPTDFGVRTNLVEKLRSTIPKSAAYVSGARQLEPTEWSAQIIVNEPNKEGWRRFPPTVRVNPLRSVTAVPLKTETGAIARPRQLSFDGGETPITEDEKAAILKVSDVARRFYDGATGAVNISTAIPDLSESALLTLKSVKYRGNVPEQVRATSSEPQESGSVPAASGGIQLSDAVSFAPNDSEFVPTPNEVPFDQRALRPSPNFSEVFGDGGGTLLGTQTLGGGEGTASAEAPAVEEPESAFGDAIPMLVALGVSFLLIFGGR